MDNVLKKTCIHVLNKVNKNFLKTDNLLKTCIYVK